MRFLILLIFVVVPIIEIAIFIEAGHFFGFWTTLSLIAITAIIGTGLLRHQGTHAFKRAKSALLRNELPFEEVITGLCLLLAGAFLLTPGFLTDFLGFLLFIARFRIFLSKFIFRYMRKQGFSHAQTTQNARDEDFANDHQFSKIIDGEFHEINDISEQNYGRTNTKRIETP